MTAARAAVVLPALVVAAGAVVATAHGLFAVAVAAKVPEGIAWLYPLITDGLALVAYAATHQLAGRERGYAWSVVVLAAVLSGLAQAAYLAGGSTVQVSPPLGFGVGAWPAVAAAIVAHLVYLLITPATAQPRTSTLENHAEPGEALIPVAEPNADDETITADAAQQDETVQEMVDRRALNLVPPPAEDRAAELIAAGVGRKRLAKELDIPESQARRLIDEARQA